nr:MAG TPA: hypothetical protein [Bacteriophage sp.]
MGFGNALPPKPLLNYCYVGCLRSLGSINNIKFYGLSLYESLVTVHLQCAEMAEHVNSIFACNETIALCGVEPFNCTFSHGASPFLKKYLLNNPCGCLTYTKSFFLLIQKVAIYVKSPLGFTLSLYGISNRQFLPFHKFTERNHIHLQLFRCIFWCHSLIVHCFLPQSVRFAVP